MARAAVLPLLLGLVAGCADDRAAPRPPEDRYAGRGRLGDLADPFPPTTAPPTGDGRRGVPPAQVRGIDSRRRRDLTPLIDAIALSEGVDPALVHAVISQESAYHPTAVSRAGAAGLMQLMPATAARFGLTPEERFDPERNVRAGIRYLKFLQRRFGGNLDLVLAGYNAGEGAVLKYGRQIPPFEETQDYVRKVKGYYALYRPEQHAARARRIAADDRRRTRVGQVQRERERTRERTTVGY
ncbi:MAG: lytic transglycosylase domain-containing protein [Candidatus Competibacteraceae bacterium]|nr:MAG: lytic transglycosylase domain-containing protein [Candidatus Competibacteraceae bacterium]